MGLMDSTDLHSGETLALSGDRVGCRSSPRGVASLKEEPSFASQRQCGLEVVLAGAEVMFLQLRALSLRTWI